MLGIVPEPAATAVAVPHSRALARVTSAVFSQKTRMAFPSGRNRQFEAFSRKTPRAFRQSASGLHSAEPARQAPEFGRPGEGCDPTRMDHIHVRCDDEYSEVQYIH